MTLQIVAKRDPHAFEVLPRRWVVERTFAWISKHRRTVRDYEHLPASHEAMILWAMIALMTRRLAQPAHLSDAHLACCLTSGFDRADVGLLFWLCGCAGPRGGWVVLLAYDRFSCSPMSASNAYACCGNGD